MEFSETVTTKKTDEDLSSTEIFRLIDATLNRLREGIRVLEDISRFIYNNKKTSKKLKDLRHLSRVENYNQYLKTRDIIGDVLKENTESEFSRSDLSSVILANFKRAQESARSLEESFKLLDPQTAVKFKHIRYELYDLEKNF